MGSPSAPTSDSCGSAAFLGEPVVVSKIETDARWIPFRELARSHELRACWSTPIKSSEGRVLGTLALYYREPREPGLWELTLIDVATQLATIAIEREAVALRSVAHLANAAAHEINNPLTVIFGRLNMLADRIPAQGPEREWLSSALEAANRIQDVIGGMHQISRLEYLQPGQGSAVDPGHPQIEPGPPRDPTAGPLTRPSPIAGTPPAVAVGCSSWRLSRRRRSWRPSC